MDIEIRPIEADELAAFARAEHVPFGEHFRDEGIDVVRGLTELDRTLAAVDDGAIVGTAAAITSQLTLPGATTAPVAAVTAVGVLPTHRRRGLLTSMMRQQLLDVRERGEPLAALGASESVIYGRFGYGVATYMASMQIEREHAAFLCAVDVPGRLRLLDKADAPSLLPPIFERHRLAQHGQVERTPGLWNWILSDHEWNRHGATALFFVVHEDDQGRADGYAMYRIRRRGEEAVPRATVVVEEIVGDRPEIEAALWQFVLDIDLTQRVELLARLTGAPLRWWLADPRRLRTTNAWDQLWVRVLDVAAALSARRYRAEGSVVLEVHDGFLGGVGCFRLEAGPDGADCRATDAEADLALGAGELGSVLLGGVSLASLAEAGRVDELHVGARARADLLFGTDTLPYCTTDF